MPFFIRTVTILMYVRKYVLFWKYNYNQYLQCRKIGSNVDLALFQTQPRNKLAVSNEKSAIFVQLCFILQRLIISWLGQSLKIVDFIFIAFFLAIHRKDAQVCIENHTFPNFVLSTNSNSSVSKIVYVMFPFHMQ